MSFTETLNQMKNMRDLQDALNPLLAEAEEYKPTRLERIEIWIAKATNFLAAAFEIAFLVMGILPTAIIKGFIAAIRTITGA